MRKTALLLLLALIVSGTEAYAQTGGALIAEIEGSIYRKENNKIVPIDYATVSIEQMGIHTITNKDGEFRFENLRAGKVNIVAQYIGMESIDTLVDLRPGINLLSLEMKVADFRMEEVVVTAVSNKAGQSTSSTITRQAIDHLQASSLSDILQLLPGVQMANTDMGNPNRLSIRGEGTMNSMGTALIVDGAQQSNNANLQMFAPSASGSTTDPLYYQKSVDNTAGVDTRSLSLDNIESVEVIRGIPSAEYGDLTSGAVIVKTRAGRDPLKISASVRPEQYQASVSNGISLGEKGGHLNLSGDYLYMIKRPIESYWNYRRVTLNSLWSKRWNEKFNTNTSLNMHYGLDSRTSNPDDVSKDLKEGGRDITFSLNTNGTYNINMGWFRSIEYGLSGKYSDKVSWKEETLSSALGLHSTAMQNGTIISNWPGRNIYDEDGREITNIPAGEENSVVTYTPSDYFSRYDIYGKEIYFNARLKTVFYKNWDKVNNRIILGADFKLEGNRGQGKVWDEATPPKTPTNNRGYRQRPYYEIPFLRQTGLYAEDKFQATFWNEREFILSAGIRFDDFNGKSSLAPRVNASFDIFPKTFTLRGGYGIASKAPMLVHLYPENAYFDLPLYNNLGVTDPNEYLVISKTYAYSTENPDLKVATNTTKELGFDIRIKNRYRLSVTAYDALHDNGYSIQRSLETFQLVEQPRYTLSQSNPGDIPTLTLTSTDNKFLWYYTPQNTSYTHNQGVEFELDFGRFEAIRTSLIIDGAWVKSTSKNTGYSFSDTTPTSSGVIQNIGVYEPGRIENHSERLTTTFRITHNIPQIGFVITLTSQLNLYTKTWNTYNSDMFVKYISGVDGNVYDFDPAMIDDINFRYLVESISPNREWVEKSITTLFFNLNLTKEIGSFLRASFFANNMFFDKPQYQSTKNKSNLITLGDDIFFGFNILITIK